MTAVRRAIGIVGLGAVASRGLLFARDAFLARALGAGGYGIWVELVVLFSWMLHLPIGFQNVLSRDVPFFRGRGDQEGVDRIQDATLRVTILTALLAAAIIVPAGLLWPGTVVPVSGGLAVLVAVTVIVQQYNGYQSVLLRAHERFASYSVGVLGTAGVSLAGAATLVPRWGVAGAVVAQCLGLSVATIWWWRAMPRGTSAPRWLAGAVRAQVPAALPLFVGGGLTLLLSTLDRLFVVGLYPAVDVGRYGFAYTMTQAVHLVVTPVAQVVHPRMMRDFGRLPAEVVAGPYLRLYIQIIPGLALVVLGAGTLVAPLLLPRLLPDFVSSLAILRYLVPGATLFVLSGGAQGILVACQHERLVVAGNLVAAAVATSVFMLGTRAFDATVEDFARLVNVANALLAAGWTWLAVSRVERPSAGAMRRTAALLAPVMLLAALLEMATRVAAMRGGDPGATLVTALLWVPAGGAVLVVPYRQFRRELAALGVVTA
jgi:O-antigen/teichoic acid export membrane protein